MLGFIMVFGFGLALSLPTLGVCCITFLFVCFRQTFVQFLAVGLFFLSWYGGLSALLPGGALYLHWNQNLWPKKAQVLSSLFEFGVDNYGMWLHCIF